ncbi:MAG: gliding motility protein GldN [Bacteroidaceae bacterium]|nr:gliding motility protein GldN [Bacteroidaceae bacterium]
MKRICILITVLACSLGSNAQPAKRRTVTPTSTKAATTQKAAAEKTADRAALSFPTSAEMPEDVVWRRDIYRQLDLLKDANAPLYYPVEPRGKEQNLFTYLFRLFISGRINAYNYKLDGNESFDEKDKANVKELLERYRIYYEEQGGRITVPESDIPSAQVTRFYMKESCYFDQRSATYKTRVTALCPVLMEGDEFESIDNEPGTATPKPLFWIKYDDVAQYLSRMPVMASNFNNVTNMTVDDYFTMNRYEGKIYKTNNLQGRVLANYAKTDSAMTAEQKRIEQQLVDFENSIWHAPTAADSTASVDADAKAAEKKATRRSKSEASSKEQKSEKSSSTRRSSAAKEPKQAKVSSGSAPRVSARRQRR